MTGRPPPRGRRRRRRAMRGAEEVAPGQVFMSRRTSLRAGSASQVFARYGTRLKTMALVTGLDAATESDMPSKPVCGRELAGGFDSRPPPLVTPGRSPDGGRVPGIGRGRRHLISGCPHSTGSSTVAALVRWPAQCRPDRQGHPILGWSIRTIQSLSFAAFTSAMQRALGSRLSARERSR
jgi:hypothetical protein